MSDSELDFSNLDGMDDIDWSDVEAELQQNREMLRAEADANKPAEPAPADFSMAPAVEASAPVAVKADIGIDFLMDIPLRLRVEVGRARLTIKNLLSLDIGSVLELKKKIGAPMDVLINDKLVAKGEIIIQYEKFG